LVFQSSTREIVKIKVAPIIPLGKPDDFVGTGQVVPVHAAPSGFVLRGGGFFEDLAHRAGSGVRNTQLRTLVVA